MTAISQPSGFQTGDMPTAVGQARKVTATVTGTFDAAIPPVMPQFPGMMLGAPGGGKPPQ